MIQLHIKPKILLKKLLGDPKQTSESFEKFEMYGMNCNDYCGNNYSQSRRDIKTCHGEHLSYTNYGVEVNNQVWFITF